MTEKYLDRVYGAKTPDETRDLYDAWATAYDNEVAENGYATPGRVAEALAQHSRDKTTPVLDFGCGTGLSGAALRLAGFTTVDGADLSADMLKVAADRHVYRSLWQVAPGDSVPSGYGAMVAAGVIGAGAAPPEVFDTLLGALPPGGLFALSFNDHALADPDYVGRLKAASGDGRAKVLFEEHGPHLPGIGLEATVYVLEKA